MRDDLHAGQASQSLTKTFVMLVLIMGLMPSVTGTVPLILSSPLAVLTCFGYLLFVVLCLGQRISWNLELLLGGLIFILLLFHRYAFTEDYLIGLKATFKPVIFVSCLFVIFPLIPLLTTRDARSISEKTGWILALLCFFAMWDQSVPLYFIDYDANYLSVALLGNIILAKHFRQFFLFSALVFLLVLTFSRMGLFLLLMLLGVRVFIFVAVLSFLSFLEISDIYFFTELMRLPAKAEGIASATGFSSLALKALESSRFDYWHAALGVIYDTPFGIGPGMSPFAIGLNGFPSGHDAFFSGAPGNTPHNYFLLVLLEYGILAGALMIVLTVLLLRKFVLFDLPLALMFFLFAMLLDLHIQSSAYYVVACMMVLQRHKYVKGERS